MDTVSVGRGYLRVLVIVYPQISTIDADMNQKKICGICGLSFGGFGVPTSYETASKCACGLGLFRLFEKSLRKLLHTSSSLLVSASRHLITATICRFRRRFKNGKMLTANTVT